MIKTVISDVDGTLIYKGSHLNTARFPIMLSKLKAHSLHFAVATGRNFCELEKLFGNYINSFTAVCCDGAYTVSHGNQVYSLPVPKACLKSFFDAFAGTDTAVEFHSLSEHFVLGGKPLFLSKERARLGNVVPVYTHSELNADIYKICVYGNKKASFSPEGLRVCYNSCGITEYINRNASKYTAVKNLLESLSLSENELLYFGDGENDRELIEKSAISYTTYCADKKIFPLTKHHTRDVIGTVIRLCDEKSI